MRTKHIIRLAMAGLFMVNLALVAVFVTATPGTAQAQTGQTVNIEIKDFKFGPDTLKIPVGTKVVWTNKDSVGHTVTSANAGVFGSDLIKQNTTFEFTFSKAGTYEYFCQPHPFMKAKIEVTEAAAPATTTVAATTTALVTTVAVATTTAPAMAATTTAMAAMTTSSAMASGTAMPSAMTTTSGAAMSSATPASSTSSSTNDSGNAPFIIVGAAIVLALAGGGFFLLRGRAGK